MGVGSDLIAWFVWWLMNAHDNTLPYMGSPSYFMALFCVEMILVWRLFDALKKVLRGCEQHSVTDSADRMSQSCSIIQNST
jgi:hypothetical protein